MKTILIILAWLKFTSAITYEAEMDLITNLPGTDSLNIHFKQYSGYLQATEGRHLHYWFVESQNNSAEDPLVLWLNGGPGCSSLLGFLTENGPFYVNEDMTLSQREYSWNKNANVIYLESPACVGFSYDDDGNCRSSDNSTAEQNYLALKDFFKKFPEYRQNELFITGESYAGLYIPLLSVTILEGNDDFPINFQGYAIGNGLLSYRSNTNSLMFFSRYHTIIDDDLWGRMVKHCCVNGIESVEGCHFIDNLDPICNYDVLEATLMTYYGGLNMYNLLGDCEPTSKSNAKVTREHLDKKNLFGAIVGNNLLRGIDVRAQPPCVNNDVEKNYLNSDTVKEALHIPVELDQEWELCSDTLRFSRNMFSSTKYVQKLVDAEVRGLIYNGDVDMAVNFIGNKWDLESLDLTPIRKYQRAWTYEDQVGGFVTRYNFLDFVTVRGAGHMVPDDKPGPAYHMIMAFLNDEEY